MEGILFFLHSLDQPRMLEQNSDRFVPDLHKKFWALAAPFHREMGLARGNFWQRGGGLTWRGHT